MEPGAEVGKEETAAPAEAAPKERRISKRVLTVMIPSAVFVALIANPIYSLGIYEASVIFIALFMRVLGKYGWGKIAAVSVGVMFAFFLMFEVWFKVPLPKGPIEALFGFH